MFSESKLSSGTLSDGRNFIIGNLRPARKKLVMYISRPDTMIFDKEIVIGDGYSDKLGFGFEWHYPSACEADDKLYIAYTANLDETRIRRSLVVTSVEIASI